MMTKLSRMDSSSSSLKYSVRTCEVRAVQYQYKADSRDHLMRTEQSRWRNKMISIAFELRLDMASTTSDSGQYARGRRDHTTNPQYRLLCRMCI